MQMSENVNNDVNMNPLELPSGLNIPRESRGYGDLFNKITVCNFNTSFCFFLSCQFNYSKAASTGHKKYEI